MYEVEVVQERYRAQELTGEGLYVGTWKWDETASLEEVENGES